MHYVDRKTCSNPPLNFLKKLDNKYSNLWNEYHKIRSNPNVKNISRPNSGWLHNDIRNPLRILFYKNCGYCGIHTDLGSDAEVDHHFPTSLNLLTDKIYCWSNYIWSCHSCNGMKKNNYPFLDPCIESDMKHIYFNAQDGKYMYYNDIPIDIKEKLNVFESWYRNIHDKLLRPQIGELSLKESLNPYFQRIFINKRI